MTYRTLARIIFLCACCIPQHDIYALEGDGLSYIPSVISDRNNYSTPSRFTLEPAYDFVSDTTDYEGPVANGEAVDSVKISRYEGAHLMGDLRVNDDVMINFGQWKREFANKRDQFSLVSRQAAIQYRLPWSWLGNSYALRLGWWSNQAGELLKSSYTRLEQIKITSLVVEQPVDQQQQLNFMVARDLDATRQLSAFVGIGQSRVNYKRITGTLVDEKDCEYRFELDKTAGRVEQQGRCGNLLSSITIMPNETSITNNLGFNPADDLQYRSLFFQLGVGYSWRTRYWQSRFGYYFQRFDRGRVDQRIKQSSGNNVEDNHSVSADIAYHFNRSVSVFWRGEYVTSRLLTMVPLSYNAYTAERFSEAGLFFTVGLRLSI